MPDGETLDFLHAVADAVCAGDWDAYAPFVEDPVVTFADRETEVHAGPGERREEFRAVAGLVAARGWDGFSIRVLSETACGPDFILVRAETTPLRQGERAGDRFIEGYLLRRREGGLSMAAFLQPTGVRLRTEEGPLAGPDEVRAPAGAPETPIWRMGGAIAAGDVDVYLRQIDTPFILLAEWGTAAGRPPGLRDELAPAVAAMAERVGRWDFQVLETQAYGADLVVQRVEVRCDGRAAGPLDPYQAVYVLRLTRDGWRIAGVMNPALGRFVDYAPGLGWT